MHWEELEKSKNIEVDCLGLRSNDVEAGTRCLEEVRELRQSARDRGLAWRFDQMVDRFRTAPLFSYTDDGPLTFTDLFSSMKLQFSSDDAKMQARVQQFKHENRDLFQK